MYIYIIIHGGFLRFRYPTNPKLTRFGIETYVLVISHLNNRHKWKSVSEIVLSPMNVRFETHPSRLEPMVHRSQTYK